MRAILVMRRVSGDGSKMWESPPNAGDLVGLSVRAGAGVLELQAHNVTNRQTANLYRRNRVDQITGSRLM